ncbi:unnamed protein product, partial [Gongylonema pulchrum]|uniref:MRP-L46 domain-containing protein n=1 Tax=Gongylonema pulchrum TaxID=637853 RepID=A0A183EMU0_9BILA
MPSACQSTCDIFAAVALVRPPVIAPPMNKLEQRYSHVMAEREIECSLRSDFELRQLRDERPPVIAPPMNKLEQRYSHVMAEREIECSLRSDFELRQLRDERLLKERERLKMSNEEGTLSEEIGILASVDEENWRKQGDRIRKQLAIGDLSRFAKADSRSLQRKIDEPLVFIVRHKFGRTDGYETNWLLPQVQHQTSETLKQTAERCLKTVISNEVEVEGLSNAPFSVYSYNYPSRLRKLLKTQSRSAVVSCFFFSIIFF